MPQASNEQEPQGESLTPDAEATQVESAPTQPVATGEQTTPANASDDTSPPEVTGPPKDDRPRDEQGRFAPKQPETAPDPVQEAIAKLAKPEKAPPASKPAPEGKPTPEAKPDKAKPTQDASTTSTPVDDLDAPEAEKAAWKPHTRERFNKVLTTLRTEREARAADAPFIQKGKEFDGLLTEYGLQEDVGFVPKEHIAGLIAVQASVNRGLLAIQQGRIPAKRDAEALMQFGQTVDQLRAQFGVQAPATQAAPAPFTGELPADLKDLVEVYGIDEKRVRLLAALEAKAPAAAQAPTPQPPPAPAPPAPPAAQAEARPEGVDMGALYSRRLIAEITATGDQNAAQTMRVLLAHPATKNEVMRKFPGTTPADAPAVFNALDPREKYEVLAAAHKSMSKPVPARSTIPPPATTNRTVTTTATPRRAAPEANGDPVAAAIAFMARE